MPVKIRIFSGKNIFAKRAEFFNQKSEKIK